MIYFNTIDLDHSALAVLELVMDEIAKCPNVSSISWRTSPSGRGFHIKFYCKKPCLKCRLNYDDVLRVRADLKNRTECERNILWDKKCYKNVDTGEVSVKFAGSWNKYK